MRDNSISWNEYFMSLALLSSQRSKDKDKQVGACIINKYNHVISMGYNGLPNNFKDTSTLWCNDLKKYLVVHAELNAILNAKKDLTDHIMYCTLFPCSQCARAIVQSGIKKVIFLKHFKKDSFDENMSQLIFRKGKVECVRYENKSN